MELLMEYMGKGMVIMLMISMPCVLTAAGIGLVVGIIQAVTQVQEQTIAAAPKIVGVFLVIIILGVGYVKLLTEFIVQGTNMAFQVVPSQDDYVIDSNYYKYTKPFTSEMTEQGNVEYIMKHPDKNNFIDNQGKVKYVPSTRTNNPTPNLIEKNKIMKGTTR
ncbi:flagellar biosynthetic protein FliQ [bacterium]|nr:flagellar biosynthetic protein FliQ [bacterium]